MSSKMARMLASEVGLSTTMTNSGLFEDARTSPQVPSSRTTRMPFTVITSRTFWPAISLAGLGAFLVALDDAVDDAVLQFVRAFGRHGRRLPCLGQCVLEVGHRLVRVTIEHVADGERGDQPVVVTPAERRVEEEVA